MKINSFKKVKTKKEGNEMKKLLSLFLVGLLVVSSGVSLRAEEIIPIPAPIPFPEPIPQPGTRGYINITEGWNLVAMPVIPAKPFTVKDFVRAVESPFLPLGPVDYPGQVREGETSIEIVEEHPIICPPPMWKISAMAVYKNGRFVELYPHWRPRIRRNRIAYNMVPGEAYFVRAKYLGPRPLIQPPVYQDGAEEGVAPYDWRPSTSVLIKGRVIARTLSVSLNLNKGWNGASLLCMDRIFYQPHQPILEQDLVDPVEVPPPPPTRPEPRGNVLTRVTSLRRLSDELVDQGIKAKKIIFWDKYNQRWEKHDLPLAPIYSRNIMHVEPDPLNPMPITMPPIFLDRFINPSEGFFLLCEENGLYEPGLPISLDIPDPIRASHTGRVEHALYVAFGPPPPFTHIMKTNDDKLVHLRGANDSMDKKLDEAAAEPTTDVYVSGVVKTMLNYNGLPDGAPGRPVDVLMVDIVAEPIQFHN